MEALASRRDPTPSRRNRLAILSALLATAALPLFVDAQSPAELAPWLTLPPGWFTTVESGFVVAVPGDLAPGAALLVRVEPVRELDGDLDSDYPEAVADLGPWTPAADPTTLEPGKGWTYRFGVGVAELDGQPYTALVAVARGGRLRARFWVLADNDETYTRYQTAWANAITSVQRLTDQGTVAAGPGTAVPGEPATRVEPYVVPAGGLPEGFGKGISGAYVGWERGLTASAGTGGLAMTFDPRTGQLGSAVSGAAPTVRTTVVDYETLQVFLPDGTYRFGLPYRGLGGDVPGDRRMIPPRWGTWREENGRVVVTRGGWRGEYVVDSGMLIDDRDRPWVKVKLPEAMRVEGIFVRQDFQDPVAPRLLLHTDGTYEDVGGFMGMVASAMALVAPDGDTGVERWTQREADYWLKRPSAGTYTLEKFTLSLTAQDGRQWQVGTYVPSDEPQDAPCRMVINTYRLVNLACPQ